MRFLALLIVIAITVGTVFVGVVFLGRRSKASANDDSWERIWNLRQAALEALFGSADDLILTAIPPFYLGGSADVLSFRKHLDGIAYVTASLIGESRSKPNEFGQYELMICVREDVEWAPRLMSNLAMYTAEAVLAPNDTMDIGAALPAPTNISSFLFLRYANVIVDGKASSVMLCIGITADELKYIRDHDVADLVMKLKKSGVYPFTDLDRSSSNSF